MRRSKDNQEKEKSKTKKQKKNIWGGAQDGGIARIELGSVVMVLFWQIYNILSMPLLTRLRLYLVEDYVHDSHLSLTLTIDRGCSL
jgi:hypothetical protein